MKSDSASLSGKHVAILGAGRSGRAAAVLALREGARVSIWDAQDEAAFGDLPEEISRHPHATPETGGECHCDLLVVSPGIDTYGPLVEGFSRHADEVIGEVELASRYFPGKIVGITGTNGKTTCTELVARILAAAGTGGTACGNYGLPFSEVVIRDAPPAAVALELSSFQLETVTSLRPDVAVWLNFAPDHMDRYPTVDAYHAAKSRIFEFQSPAETAVVRFGENIGGVAARQVTFSTEEPSADWFSDGRQVFRRGELVFDLATGSALRGLHNAENAMAAMAAAEALGLSFEAVRAALHGYAPPPHRCELIRTLDGVEYLNDSKATNLHALQSALRSQTRPVVLIAGGKDKGLDYRPLMAMLRERVLAVVTFGEIGPELARLFHDAVPSAAVATLGEALADARSRAPRGSSVLLSPGTSSFDQFRSYEHRGDAFRELVHAMH